MLQELDYHMALSYTLEYNGLEQNCDNICLYCILLYASVFYTCVYQEHDIHYKAWNTYTILGYIECINDLTRYIVIFTISMFHMRRLTFNVIF